MKQADPRNLSMVMDLYELTMANGYFNDGDIETRVAFGAVCIRCGVGCRVVAFGQVGVVVAELL